MVEATEGRLPVGRELLDAIDPAHVFVTWRRGLGQERLVPAVPGGAPGIAVIVPAMNRDIHHYQYRHTARVLKSRWTRIFQVAFFDYSANERDFHDAF